MHYSERDFPKELISNTSSKTDQTINAPQTKNTLFSIPEPFVLKKVWL
jgi:hypothetical protein